MHQLRLEIIASLDGMRAVPFSVDLPADHLLDSLLSTKQMEQEVKLLHRDREIERLTFLLAKQSRPKWYRRMATPRR